MRIKRGADMRIKRGADMRIKRGTDMRIKRGADLDCFFVKIKLKSFLGNMSLYLIKQNFAAIFHLI